MKNENEGERLKEERRRARRKSGSVKDERGREKKREEGDRGWGRR